MSEYSCNLCKDENKEFKVPAGDHVGVALMKQHLMEKHGVQELINQPKGWISYNEM